MRWLLIIVVAVSSGVIGCQPNSPTAPRSTTAQIDQAAEKLKTAREEYLAALKADMERADRDIDDLKKKAMRASGDAKVAMDKKIKELESHRGEVHGRFEDFKADTRHAFDEMRKGMDKSWSELKDSIHKAKEEFQ